MNRDALIQMLMHLGQAGESEQVPADEHEISALPTHQVTEDEISKGLPAEHKSCTICLDDFKAGDLQRTLPCFHRFHKSCVDRWLATQGECPICKHRVSDGDSEMAPSQ